MPCNPSCASCVGNTVDQCQACTDGHKLVGTTCVVGCVSGYYLNNGHCAACSANCTECKDVNTCTACQTSLFLTKTGCVTRCPDGTYPSNGMCLPCNSACKTCNDGTTNSCPSCVAGYMISNGNQCVSKCGSGQYQSTDGSSCLNCNSTCLECTNATTCASCNSPQVLQKGVC